MKKCTFFFSFLLLPFSLIAQSEETELKATLSNVTIHLQGAELVQSASVPVKTGRQRFVFTGLSPRLNPQSIQVTANKDVSILSITSKINFMKEGEASPAIKKLQDSMEVQQRQLQAIADEQNAYERERDLLLQNQALSGKDASLPVEELVKAADFFRSRFKEINRSLSEFKRKNSLIQKEINRLNQQLQELNAGKRPTSEVYVDVDAQTTATSTFRLRYVVNEAGWSPVYDLVSTGLNEPIKLKYRALAFNDTGVDWKDVKIRLSTADPYQDAGQPKLEPWVLNTPPPAAYNQGLVLEKGRLNQLDAYQNSQNLNYQQDLKTTLADKLPAVTFETIEISELSKDFDIESPYTIPADRKPYSIEITEYQLDATYKHYAVPKLEKDAFLLAQIIGWEKLDLISGPMNVYRNENFIGLAQLSTRTLSDTLELSLGRDGNVLVTRTKLQDFSKKQFLGGSKISSFTYKISVKNNHRQPVSIEINDQVPVSQTKDISVDIKETSNARRIDESGKLVWELNVAPAEVKSVQFGYAIKHPANMEVRTERMRSLASPRFY